MEYRYQGTKWGIWNAMIDRVIKKCLCGNGFWIQGGEGAERDTLCLEIGGLFAGTRGRL